MSLAVSTYLTTVQGSGSRRLTPSGTPDPYRDKALPGHQTKMAIKGDFKAIMCAMFRHQKSQRD